MKIELKVNLLAILAKNVAGTLRSSAAQVSSVFKIGASHVSAQAESTTSEKMDIEHLSRIYSGGQLTSYGRFFMELNGRI